MPLVLSPQKDIDRTIWDSFKNLRRTSIDRTTPPLFVDYQNQRIGIGALNADYPLDIFVISNFRKLIKGRGFFMSENCAIGGALSINDNLIVSSDVGIAGQLHVQGKAWFNQVNIEGGSINNTNLSNAILTSPNGTRYQLGVSNGGTLTTTLI